MRSDSMPPEIAPLLTLSEVAAIFGVEPDTVRRWARAGKLTPVTAIRTLTGQACFAGSEVRALINGADSVRDMPGRATTILRPDHRVM